MDIEEFKKRSSNAQKYFPEFFSFSEINKDKKPEDAREIFLGYCEKYFMNFDPSANEEKKRIKEAYEFVLLSFRQEKMKKQEHPLLEKLDMQINLLMQDLESFHFDEYNKRTVGAKMNRANKQIIDEISSWRPFIDYFYKVVNTYFDEAFIGNEFSFLVERLECVIRTLFDARINFEKVEEKYRSISADAFYDYRPEHTRADVGKAKKEWKKSRNNICYSLAWAIGVMDEILNRIIAEKSIDCSRYEKEEYLEYIYKSIKKSPNYYCFLSEEDRKEETERNIQYKKMTRASRREDKY